MEFLEMDKYALHVWTVYGLTFLLIFANAWFARIQFHSARSKALHRLNSRGQLDSQSDKYERDIV
jgi:heme exporter protein D